MLEIQLTQESALLDQFQPKFSLTTNAGYQFHSSMAMASRSGGFNSTGSAALTNFWLNSGNPFGLGAVGAGISVNDEFEKVSRAFEVGFKGSYLDGRLAMNELISIRL